MVTSPARLWELLDAVPDPELPAVTITDLGIVREIREDAGEVVVALTPTYSGCPATAMIEESVRDALHERGVDRVRIERRLAPAWTTDWITPRGRTRLHEHGIVPPSGTLADGPIVTAIVRCPQCASTNTSELSRFGSTPCKALYRCNDCREPFDYVKPH
ncbi:MAG TPA: 1,2-phenylacetyl-CoA epoxidase subunit PaaD [Candidatus Baltobacteraceae bacterium]|nr:1,2-phenylacetyl-CoA epoxidase subunit PaaD [Candidatus Baltobacteraceae bacterium]